MSKTFSYWGTPLEYCTAEYNSSRLNERAVEIPIAEHVIAGRSPRGRFHEIGNVLGHYGHESHTVIDRYEQAPGVANLDVFELVMASDLIVAVSTVEHVRWDENPRLPTGASDAIAHLRSLLRPGGLLLVTVPLGYHAPLDRQIMRGEIAGVDRECTLVRDADANWEQTETLTWRPYGATQPWAESVWIAEITP